MSIVKKYNKQNSGVSRSVSDHRPIKWIVKMYPEWIQNDSGYENTVAYHTSLDNSPTSALSQAIHTASRYDGKLYAYYSPDDIQLVKSYYSEKL